MVTNPLNYFLGFSTTSQLSKCHSLEIFKKIFIVAEENISVFPYEGSFSYFKIQTFINFKKISWCQYLNDIRRIVGDCLDKFPDLDTDRDSIKKRIGAILKQCKKSYMRALKKEEERKKEPVEQSVADALTVRYQNKPINYKLSSAMKS